MLRKWLSFTKHAQAGRRGGSSMVEFALLMPWYAFLFVGAFDFGFYCYSLIATQNAARLAALYCSGSSSLATNCSTLAESCLYALDSLRMMPNVGSSMSSCASSPIVLTSSVITTVDSTNATQVTVAYTTPTLIPIPGFLTGGLTISRTVTMKVVT